MIYWIWLTQIPFIGPVTTRYLIKELGDAEKIYQADHETLSGMSGLSARQRESIIRNHSLEKAKRIMDDCQNKNISILCWNDERYPLRAREPADAPPMLYYKGNIKKMDQTVGIVGARRCSQEAKQETVFLASEYAKTRIAVVSGMAKGIDSYAHTACLNAGGWLYNSNIRKWPGYLLSKRTPQTDEVYRGKRFAPVRIPTRNSTIQIHVPQKKPPDQQLVR